MASNNEYDNYEEKPNLRPTKHQDAGGKTIFLHHNPNQPHNKSYIRAVWNESNDASTKENPFGIEQPHVEYSLNKQERWETLNSFRRQLAGQTSSSSDEEINTQSDSEQSKTKKLRRRRQKDLDTRQTKSRLYEFHNTNRAADCVSITTNTGSQRTTVPRQTYMRGPPTSERQDENAPVNDENRQARNTTDVTYYAVVPPPKEKQLSNIRKQVSSKPKKSTTSYQRSKFTQVKDSLNAVQQFGDEEQISSTDEEELIASVYASSTPGQLHLDDFIPPVPLGENTETTVIAENLVTITPKLDPKGSRVYPDGNPSMTRYHRQVTREEKVHNRDKPVHQPQKKQPPKPGKSLHHLMSLSFMSVKIVKSDLTVQYLSNTFGKNFIHAQSSPTKYLIRLTDQLKSVQWENNFQLFPAHATLDCYLILIINDETSDEIQIGVNMDLFSDTLEIEGLHDTPEPVYSIKDLIKKTVEFISRTPFDRFKPIDSELSRKRTIQNEEDGELSESEYLNKQIRHLRLLDKSSSSQTKAILEDEQLNTEMNLDEYALIKPDICTNCYRDIDENIPMTALKVCAHWLCNDCWRQYLEHSIKQVKIVLCPEWNCESIVDVGTILSLVNVRCMNIYERNIEKCLVNLSRSHIKCPSKSCTNIIQVIGSGIDHVRCRCGHQFCISCKQEPHFPCTCNAYRIYMDEVFRNGDLISDYNAVTQVKGRKCVSCDNFIEKNGGCNHMTCRCGAEFCWTCTAYWKDHYTPDGSFKCPREPVALQEEILAKQHNTSRRYYYNSIYHRRERTFQIQSKFNENAKRLLGTIPLDKGCAFNSALIKSQIDKRESVLRHLYEMVKYIMYLHRVCEFVAVSADGYGTNPSEFRNSLQPLETNVFNLSQVLEGGRGYKAIEQIKQLHANSERLIERLQRAVTVRELRRSKTSGYVTS